MTIHTNLSFKDYQVLPGVNNSFLNDLNQSPAHAIYRKLNPKEPTEALLIGQMQHTAILEPHKFADAYEIFDGDLRTNAAKERKANIEARGKIAIKPAHFELAKGMSAALWGHPLAKELLSGAKTELSATWEADGVAKKARIDAYNHKLGAVIDLKTTQDARESAFKKSLVNFGYFRQAAFYLEAAKANGLEATAFYIVAVEKEAPFGVSVFKMSEGALAQGRIELKRLVEKYKECIKTDIWEAYPTTLVELDLPGWYSPEPLGMPVKEIEIDEILF